MFDLIITLRDSSVFHFERFFHVEYYGDNIEGTWQDVICKFQIAYSDDFIFPDHQYIYVDKQDYYIYIEIPHSLIYSVSLRNEIDESWCL